MTVILIMLGGAVVAAWTAAMLGTASERPAFIMQRPIAALAGGVIFIVAGLAPPEMSSEALVQRVYEDASDCARIAPTDALSCITSAIPSMCKTNAITMISSGWNEATRQALNVCVMSCATSGYWSTSVGPCSRPIATGAWAERGIVALLVAFGAGFLYRRISSLRGNSIANPPDNSTEVQTNRGLNATGNHTKQSPPEDERTQLKVLDTILAEDAPLYSRVREELGHGNIDKTLWDKASALAEGNENRARAFYVELRVTSLKCGIGASLSADQLEIAKSIGLLG